MRGERQAANRQSRESRKQLTDRQKSEIGGRTGFKCHCCGKRLNHANHKRQYDHIKAWSTGGRNGVENYLLSCDTCNMLRKAKLAEEIQLLMALGELARRAILEDTELGDHIARVAVRRDAIKSWLRKPLPRFRAIDGVD
ncbi:MAG: HNH endonuclease [Pirellulaceae bacterium]